MHLISIERIKETQTYKDLLQRKETIKASFLIKRSVREQITNGFFIFKNSGVIPAHIAGANLQIIKDLISIEQINQVGT
jgi:hypothetical protein